jgi:hypothetical protein
MSYYRQFYQNTLKVYKIRISNLGKKTNVLDVMNLAILA